MRHPMRSKGQNHRRRHRREANRLQIAEVARDKFKALRTWHCSSVYTINLTTFILVNLVLAKSKYTFALSHFGMAPDAHTLRMTRCVVHGGPARREPSSVCAGRRAQ